MRPRASKKVSIVDMRSAPAPVLVSMPVAFVCRAKGVVGCVCACVWVCSVLEGARAARGGVEQRAMRDSRARARSKQNKTTATTHS